MALALGPNSYVSAVTITPPAAVSMPSGGTLGALGGGTTVLDDSAILGFAPGSSLVAAAGTLTVSSNVAIAGTVTSTDGQLAAGFSALVSGFTVNFTSVNYSDGSGGSITTYAWTFGDSGTDTSPNPSHTYAGHGTYVVTLTITNSSSNTSTCTQTVVV